MESLGESICPYCGVGCRLAFEREPGQPMRVRGVESAPANLGRARINWDEHAQILQAVIAGDADLASLLATRHVFSAAKAVESMNSDALASDANGAARESTALAVCKAS